MQYAIQIEGIWHDLIQNLEKTRDAVSSSSVQVDAEMSPEFSRLGTCDSHMQKKWRGTAPPGGRAQVRDEQRAATRVCIRSLDRDYGISSPYGVRDGFVR